jgi:hypothetical protein
MTTIPYGTQFQIGERTWRIVDVGQTRAVAVCIWPSSRRNNWFRDLPTAVQQRISQRGEQAWRRFTVRQRYGLPEQPDTKTKGSK